MLGYHRHASVNGVSLAVKTSKKNVKVGPPLTKLSGSAHENNNFATPYNYNFISKLAHSCFWLVTIFNMTNMYYKKEEKTTSNGNVSRSGIDTKKANVISQRHNYFMAHVIFCYIF